MQASQPHTPAVLTKLAQLLGTQVIDDRLYIPARYGQGYCEGYVFNAHIRMLISNYELTDELTIDNPAIDAGRKMIFFKFQHILPPQADAPYTTGTPSVLIATSRVHTDEVIAIHTNKSVINIEVDAGYLGALTDASLRSPVIQSLLDNTRPLLFEQLGYPALQRIVEDICTVPAHHIFKLFFLRIKAEELICSLLMQLEKRKEQQVYALNGKDIQAVYNVKESILKDLSSPPVIDRLATGCNMSASKLKRLFRQVFGTGIFSYYQHFRMLEAARLLRSGKLSVSEVGYTLGFSNLSHFSRVFEAHIGSKPKKYSSLQ